MQRFNPEDLGPEFQEWRKTRRKVAIRETAFAAVAIVGAGLVAAQLNSCEPNESNSYKPQPAVTEDASAPEAVTATSERYVVSYDNPTESAQYWARGGSDEKVTVSDINVAKTYADMVEDPSEASLVNDLLSYEAAQAAAHAASGNGNGSITVNDLKVADYLADISAQYGDHSDSAYEAIADNAIMIGNYWQQGGADGVADTRDYQVSNYYYDVAAQANQAVLAD